MSLKQRFFSIGMDLFSRFYLGGIISVIIGIIIVSVLFFYRILKPLIPTDVGTQVFIMLFGVIVVGDAIARAYQFREKTKGNYD